MASGADGLMGPVAVWKRDVQMQRRAVNIYSGADDAGVHLIRHRTVDAVMDWLRAVYRFRSADSDGPDRARSVLGRRVRLLALAGLGLSTLLVAVIAITVALTVGCGDYAPGGCIDPRVRKVFNDDRLPIGTQMAIPANNYERLPAQYARVLRANMDLLEAAPTEYAAWVRANGTAASRDEMACRLILLVEARDLGCALRTRIGDDPQRVYAEKNIQRATTGWDGQPEYWDANGRRVHVYVHDLGPRYAQAEAELRAAAPALHAALNDALQSLLADRAALSERRTAMPFLRYSVVPRATGLRVEPVVSIGEAVPWRRAARFAALRRLAHAQARLHEDAPAAYAAWRQRGGHGLAPLKALNELAALIKAAPAAYAARVRAIADLVRVSPATYHRSLWQVLVGDAAVLS